MGDLVPNTRFLRDPKASERFARRFSRQKRRPRSSRTALPTPRTRRR